MADILNECKYEAKAKGVIELQYFGNVANLKKYAQRILNSCERLEGDSNE